MNDFCFNNITMVNPSDVIFLLLLARLLVFVAERDGKKEVGGRKKFSTVIWDGHRLTDASAESSAPCRALSPDACALHVLAPVYVQLVRLFCRRLQY
jgi:hypothetical protein